MTTGLLGEWRVKKKGICPIFTSYSDKLIENQNTMKKKRSQRVVI